ncbi:MAG: hypothetical protein LBP26_05925 [Clostridiales bacterium]|jgi:hypothetical protein|nr:hypothetical protein [Clostridiales bacterium]
MDEVRKTNCKLRYAAAFLALLLVVLCAGLAGLMPRRTAYADTDFEEFTATALTLDNGSFSNSGGSFPGAPSGWTETATDGGFEKGASIGGVIDLDAFNNEDSITKSELKEYPEYKSDPLPKSPFGEKDGQIKGDRKFLMINTTARTETAFGYTSGSLTLAANGYYRVSAWVKTGDFAGDKGAAIRLSGLGGDYAFNRINTARGIADLDNDTFDGYNTYGWRRYAFYVATGPLGDKTVTVTLSVGDRYKAEKDDETDGGNTASGYAFFDNVEAEQISATDYNDFSADYDPDSNDFSKYDKFINLALDSAFDGDAQREAFGFADMSKWESVTVNNTAATKATVVSAEEDLTDENAFGLKSSPVSSTGRQNHGGQAGAGAEYLDKVLVFSTYTGKNDYGANLYERAAIGRESEPLTIKRFAYYRLSVWVKTDSVSGGDGAALVLKSDKPEDAKGEKFTEFSITNAAGDAQNKARYGWKEYAFYIQGSALKDYTVKLQLWLGRKDAESAGTAMFHNARFDKLTSSQFKDNSANGTAVNFDSAFSDNERGVANGAFFLAGDYKKYEFPLAPASWTAIDASNAPANYSTAKKDIDESKIMRGIMPTDSEHFAQNAARYTAQGLINPRQGEGNVLVISSREQTILGYRSADITVTADKVMKIGVTMRLQNIDGYGAGLLLKSGENAIASIEKITSTGNGFKTFEFYVEGGAADKTVALEIWLGLADRKNNADKLSSGNVYVSQTYAEADEATPYADRKAAHIARVSSPVLPLESAIYSFKTEDFTAFDPYDSGFIKYPYNWSLTAVGGAPTDNVKYGIFDSSAINLAGGEIPYGFKNKNAADAEEPANAYVLILSNGAATASKLTHNTQYAATANNYYAVEISVKVELDGADDKAVGAGIELVGTKYKFEDIRQTGEKLDTTYDNDVFRVYKFYVMTGAEETTLSVAVTLGNADKTSRYCAGRVYVNRVSVNEITNVLYEDETAKIAAAVSEGRAVYALSADLSVAETDETVKDDAAPKGGFNWWLIPSILFSAALVLVLIGVVIRRLVENTAKAHVKHEKITEYDRNKTLNRQHNERAKDGGRVKTVDGDALYENFDDESGVPRPAEQKVKSATAVKPDPEAETAATDAKEAQTPAADNTDGAQTPADAATDTASDADATKETASDVDTAKADADTDKPETADKPEAKKPVDAYSDEFED